MMAPRAWKYEITCHFKHPKFSHCSLTRWPGHLPSSKHVNMKVVHALSACRTIVDHEAAASVIKAFKPRYFCRGPHKMAQQRLVLH